MLSLQTLAMKLGATTACTLLLITTAFARADERTPRTFDIGPQSLANALSEYARQSQQEILFAPAIVADKTTAGLRGVYPPLDALKQILGDTGLTFSTTPSGAILVQPTAAETDSSRTPSGPQAYINPDTPDADPAKKAGFWGRFRLAQNDQSSSSRTSDSDEQEESSSQSSDKSSEGRVIEEVLVTGTHIRGSTSLASPLLQFDREDIQRSGVGTTEQFIQTLPQNFGGGVSASTLGGPGNSGGEDANQNLGFGTGVNLRGLGNDSTLVLLNGRRVAPAGSGYYVDVSMFPLDAIERIDLVTDGASAVYGADAVGGVVNILLRNTYDGAETRVRYGESANSEHDDLQVGQLLGQTWGSGSALLSYNYEEQSALDAKERSFTQTVPSPTELVMPEKRHNALLSMTQQAGDRARVFADGMYAKREGVLLGNFGSRSIFDTRNKLYGGALGASIDVSQSWRSEVVASYSKTETFLNLQFPDFAFATTFDSRSDVLSLDIQADGTLAQLPGGPLKIAIGVQDRRESYDSRGQSQATLNELQRAVYAAFGEILVPIIGASNETGFASRLDLTLAARYEHYDDFGSTTNPKLGILWAPSPELVLRGTIGTSFRAPLLYELDAHSFSTGEARTLVDPTSPTGLTATVIRRGNNANLDPEEATTWTLGADISASFLPSWKTSLTYFDFRIEDRIATPVPAAGVLTALQSAGLYSSAILRNPELAFVNELYAGPSFFNRTNIPASDIRAVLDNRLTNISRRHQNGVDLSTSFSVEQRSSLWSVGLAGTYLLEIEDKITPTAPAQDSVGTVYYPPRLKLRSSIGWSWSDFSTNGFLNYTDSYRDVRLSAPLAGPAPRTRVGSWTTVDLNINYVPSDAAGGWWRSGFEASLTVQNLFDKDPPFVAGPFGLNFDTANASPVGRFLALQLRKSW